MKHVSFSSFDITLHCSLYSFQQASITCCCFVCVCVCQCGRVGDRCSSSFDCCDRLCRAGRCTFNPMGSPSDTAAAAAAAAADAVPTDNTEP